MTASDRYDYDDRTRAQNARDLLISALCLLGCILIFSYALAL